MFTDISQHITSNPPALHYGVAALDIDGDGAIEFFVAGFGGPNRVLKWINGSLKDVTPLMLVDADRQGIGVAAADIDGDGREELYVLNTDTYAGPKEYADRLFDPVPGDRWDDLFSLAAHRPIRNLTAGRSVAALDRRGTGRYGFFVANYGRPMRYYELGSSGHLVELSSTLGLNRTTGGRGLWTGPFVTPRADIVCINEHGPNFVFANRGDGTFTEIASDLGLEDEHEHARGVAVLDADGDGRLDLAYGNWDGPHRLMQRRPDGTFRDRSTPALALPSTIRTVIAADFDNDGFEELFFNNIGEPNRLFAVRPGAMPDDLRVTMLDAGPATEPLGLGTGAAIADIDGDGVLELLIAHGESAPQPLGLYKCDTRENGWLRVQPLTRFGAPARGALVRLTLNDRTLTRVMCGGSGYLCQMEPVAHFGLGSSPTLGELTVTWPDGTQVTVTDPTPNRLLRVPYPLG